MRKATMKNKFQNKEEFKDEYKRRIIEKYGRSIEQAHPTEKFMVLGEMIRDFASVNRCRRSKTDVLLFHGIFDGTTLNKQFDESGDLRYR